MNVSGTGRVICDGYLGQVHPRHSKGLANRQLLSSSLISQNVFSALFFLSLFLSPPVFLSLSLLSSSVVHCDCLYFSSFSLKALQYFSLYFFMSPSPLTLVF